MKFYRIKGHFGIYEDRMRYEGIFNSCFIEFSTGDRAYYNRRLNFVDRRKESDVFYDHVKSLISIVDTSARSRVFVSKDVEVFFRLHMGGEIDFDKDKVRGLQQSVKLKSPHFVIDRVRHDIGEVIRKF